ncbi:MAG: translocation/assembly module TamB domain-containing protein [bacterium]|nr:translocation/assembly module TamB domain-containing protein [bacterium]
MEDQGQKQPQEEQPQSRSWLRLLWLWTRRLVVGVVLFFLILSGVLQIPAVQNYLADRVTTALSDAMRTTVSIDRLNIKFLDQLVLEDFYVEDLTPGDTAIFSKYLYADFSLNPLVYLRRGLVIEDLALDSATVNIRKAADDDYNNMQVLLGRLFPPDTSATTGEKRPFYLDVQGLTLSKIRFLKEDKARGQDLDIYLADGSAVFDEFSLPDRTLHAESVILEGPYVRIDEYDYVIWPQDTMGSNAPPTEPPLPFFATIGEFVLKDGKFSLHNWRNDPENDGPVDELNYQHMDVFDINIGINEFSFCSDSLDFSGQVEEFNLRDLSGFVLEDLTVGNGRVWNRGLELYDLQLKTPYSDIGDTLIFKYDTYEAFKSFPDEVELEAHLSNASVTLKDIMTFAPKLKSNAFFWDNRDRKLYIDGLIEGTVNDLDAEDMYLALENRRLVAQGNLRTRDLTYPDFRTINLQLDELRTNMTALRQLFPKFQPPEAFDRLGWLYFTGRFDVLFSDYIAYGTLNSALGRAEMDMKVRNLTGNRAEASYSGSLSLVDFDLGGFTQNQDLGLVNFSSSVRNGKGLTAETATADLSAEVQSFIYKGYNYTNANLTGLLKKNQFSGDFLIQDEHIDFSFNGQFDMTDSVPRFNFFASVNQLSLLPLNLSQKDIHLSGDVSLNLQNSTLSELEGRGRVKDVEILHRNQDTIQVDSVVFVSLFEPGGRKRFSVDSDLMNGYLLGQFDVLDIGPALMDYLERNHNGFFERLGMKKPRRQPKGNEFIYDFDIVDTKGVLALFEPRLGPLQGVALNGYFDNEKDSITVELRVPRFRFGNIALNDAGLFARLVDSVGSINFRVEEPVLNDKRRFAPVHILADLDRDTLDIGLAYQVEGLSMLDNLNLNAELYLLDSLNYQLRFKRSNLVLLQKLWEIEPDNYITFRKGYVATEHFRLKNEERIIQLRSKGEKGLQLALNNFDFSFIDDIWEYEELDFGGPFNMVAEVDNIFKMEGLNATVMADTFLVNDDDWGALRLDANAADLKSRFEGYLAITKDTSQLIAEGFFNPEDTRRARRGGDREKAQYFNIGLNVTSFPVNIGEYWLEGTIKNTVGYFDAGASIYGFPGAPHIEGEIKVRDGATTIDFLQTRYYFDDARIEAKDFLFDATGVVVKDKYNNTATITGGITHSYLKDLGINAEINTDRFLALDTDKEDNDLFYGHALGDGQVTFKGPLRKIDIYVNATVGKDTRLVIPVSYGSNASELNFINFKKQEAEVPLDQQSNTELNGVSLEMDLNITEEAQGEIIFDEQAGDIIKGTGRGNIRILVPRNGEFEMFGDYNIEQGEYLFTLYNVVNKDFDINRGGVISWSGDPFEAQIRLEAEYAGLSTPVANFIQEYLIDAPDDLKQGASQPTEVELTMELRGDLLRPIINFDIEFPELIGGLKTLTDSKLRILRQDPNELNRQVFGLIVVGQFLPSDIAIQGADIFYNTVSEFVSNQLSLLLTELFSEFFGEQSALSGIDFDIAYNQYQANFGESQDFRRGDEFQLRMRQEFFNDRLSVLVGGNVDIGNSARVPDQTGTFVGNDLVIEYVLNRDRTLKLRIYQRLEPDIGGGSRLEVGTGLSYRKEFDSFGEFLRSFRRAAGKVRD